MKEEENLDKLRKKVLENTSIKSIEPWHCGMLSITIFKATQQKVSETTLKRIYGFAKSRFEISLRTKNALAKYCGYSDWANFKESVSIEITDQQQITSWKKLKMEMSKVNFFMLNAVKNKAIIPFAEMIDRTFIHSYFDRFLKSGALATVISAPAGYGKTIAVCQWISKKLSDQDDIVLYFNSSFLLSSLHTRLNLQKWMMKMIGLEPSGNFRNIVFNKSTIKGKFYFVVDGFDELMFRKNQFEVVLHLMLDILSIYKNITWFKIILVMRDTTWKNWKRQLMFNPASWYCGNMNEQGINVELLTNQELHALIRMERSFNDREIREKDFVMLRLPLFHQIFYRRYESIIQIDQFNEVLTYELAIDYMSQYVLHGNISSNKLDFIYYLLPKMTYEDGRYSIYKSKLNLQRRNYRYSYNSLLQIGLLREKEKNSALNKQVQLSFIHPHFFACCTAGFLLKQGENFSPVKLEYIQLRWSHDPVLKINILKWCLYQSPSSKVREDWWTGYKEYLKIDEIKQLYAFVILLGNQA